MAWRKLLFLLCSLLAAVMWTPADARAAAEPAKVAVEAPPSSVMPSRVPGELQQILSNPEFSSRLEPESLWQRILAPFKAKAKQWLRQAWRALQKVLPHMPDLGLGRFFSFLAEALGPLWRLLGFIVDYFWVLFWCAVVMALLYTLYKFNLWRYLQLHQKSVRTLVVAAKAAAVSEGPAAADLFRAGLYLEALCALHQELRRRLLCKYSLLESTTDRELLRQLPAEETESAFFSRVAGSFERFVFARQDVERETVTAIFSGLAPQPPEL